MKLKNVVVSDRVEHRGKTMVVMSPMENSLMVTLDRETGDLVIRPWGPFCSGALVGERELAVVPVRGRTTGTILLDAEVVEDVARMVYADGYSDPDDACWVDFAVLEAAETDPVPYYELGLACACAVLLEDYSGGCDCEGRCAQEAKSLGVHYDGSCENW